MARHNSFDSDMVKFYEKLVGSDVYEVDEHQIPSEFFERSKLIETVGDPIIIRGSECYIYSIRELDGIRYGLIFSWDGFNAVVSTKEGLTKLNLNL